MSAAQNEPDEVVEGSLRISTSTGPTTDEPTGARTPFYLDDDPEVYWAVKPKKAKLLSFARSAELLDLAPGAEPTMQQAAQAMGVYDAFLSSILDEESRLRIEDKLESATDPFDLDNLDPVIRALVEHWFARPTGGPRGSQPSRPTTGKRSTGRARSGGQTQKR